MALVKERLLRKMSPYLGGAGSGVAGPLCVACMVGMWGVVGGAAVAGVGTADRSWPTE